MFNIEQTWRNQKEIQLLMQWQALFFSLYLQTHIRKPLLLKINWQKQTALLSAIAFKILFHNGDVAEFLHRERESIFAIKRPLWDWGEEKLWLVHDLEITVLLSQEWKMATDEGTFEGLQNYIHLLFYVSLIKVQLLLHSATEFSWQDIFKPLLISIPLCQWYISEKTKAKNSPGQFFSGKYQTQWMPNAAGHLQMPVTL